MKRINIMKAIGDRLATITVANGYATEIGLNTFYWHDLPLEYGYPCLVYRDIAEDHEQVNLAHQNILHAEVEGLLFTDSPGIDGNKMIADIIRALGIDTSWGGLAHNTQLTKNSTLVETDGRTAVRVVVEFDVFYRTPLFQP